MKTLTLSVFVLTTINYCVRGTAGYLVPEPQIETFNKGFRFSIPHEEGIELFAFHGNINKEMDNLEAGEFSKDIVKKCDGRWVFEDTTRRLAVGDTIYFWLFVIKNGLGYRYDNGEYTVKSVSERTALICQPKPPSDTDWLYKPERSNDHNPLLDVRTNLMTSSSSNNRIMNKRGSQIPFCCELFLHSTHVEIALAEENERLKAENKILYELAQKDDYYATELKLFGRFPDVVIPRDFAQDFVKEKLRLSDIRVVEAKGVPNSGISFKVETLADKVKVITAAKKWLERSKYELSW